MVELFDNKYVMFVVVCAVVFTVYMSTLLMYRQGKQKERTKRMVALTENYTTSIEPEAPSSALASFCESILALIGTNVKDIENEMYLMLSRAGLRGHTAAVYVLFFQRIIQPLLIAIGLYYAYNFLATKKALTLVLTLIFLVIGAYGAKLYINNTQAKRKKNLQRSFPDALDLLLVCVESGLSLDTALNRVCREIRKSNEIMADELDKTRLELGIFNDRGQALQNLADRTDVPGFRALVSAMLQSEKFGTSMAETLRVLAEDFRTKRLLEAENKAARIPALITVPLILFIMPAFMLVVLGSPIIQISQHGGIMGDTDKR